MTAQVPDTYVYEGKKYSLIAMSKRPRFNPLKYGIEPQYTCTACWAGYAEDYNIVDSKLFLQRLWISESGSGYPDVNGVKVKELEKPGIFGYVYEDVNLLVKYTGKIVIGNSFIDEYYKHMGLQRAWAYKKVLELIFEKGRLVEVIDHSETVQKIREEMESEKNPYEYLEHWWI